MRAILFVGFALALLLLGCSSASERAEPFQGQDLQGDVVTAESTMRNESTATDPEMQRDAESAIFPADLLEDLDNLQVAIDISLDLDVEICMREQGWTYQAGVEQAVIRQDVLTQTLIALEMQEESTQHLEDPNFLAWSELSLNDQELWMLARDQCTVESEWNVSHPFAAEDNLLSTLRDEASDLTESDPTVISVRLTAERCFRDSGYGELGQARAQLSEAAVDLLQRDQSGEVTRAAAIAEAESLVELRRGILAAEETCLEGVAERTQEVFTEHLNAISEGNPEIPFLVSEVRDQISGYRAVLDTLIDD